MRERSYRPSAMIGSFCIENFAVSREFPVGATSRSTIINSRNICRWVVCKRDGYWMTFKFKKVLQFILHGFTYCFRFQRHLALPSPESKFVKIAAIVVIDARVLETSSSGAQSSP